MKYGRLTIIGSERRVRDKHECLCDCGNIVHRTLTSLRSGNTKSCGCLASELISLLNKTHGLTRTPEYNAWQKMKDRCLNSNSKDFEYYGGRGISVCSQWINDFQQFLKDIGPRLSSVHTLDRIDGNKNYEPENCRWATRKEQSRNRRNTHMVVFNGVSKPLGEWCEMLNIDYNNTNKRLWRGWSVDRAFKEPKRKSRLL